MSKNVIYASFSYKHHTKIAEYLFDKHQWKPVYWIGFKDFEKEVKASFPDTIFHASQEVRRGRLVDCICDKDLVPIDRKIIHSLSKYESISLGMMQRRDTTGWNFSFNERIQFYYKMLNYWNTVIHHLKLEVFVSWVIPHSAEEYILYQLCKYYKIPTLMVEAARCIEKY
ncbi:MAG: hypothetical protein JRI72_02565, partial [Deltaproteobacteria bacterium]|nr:hypothetical protein [Deltaproteobacteria bacterium]